MLPLLAPVCDTGRCLSGGYRNGLYLLRGTVVTPDEVIEEGEVLFNEGGILCAGRTCEPHPSYCNAQLVETGGYIFPGLIDPHNHITYRFLPPWDPPQQYQDRCEWIGSSDYYAYKACHDFHRDDTYRGASGRSVEYQCIMEIYGEIAALMGGVTSVQSQLSDFGWDCAEGLVRNVDAQDADGGWRGDTVDACTFPISTCSGNGSSCSNRASIEEDIESGCLQSWVPHLGEGVDCQAYREFEALTSCVDLLIPQTAIIHATAFGPEEFAQIAGAEAKIIASARSNVNLYGRTLDLPAVLDAYGNRGLEDMVAISTDWCPSGSCNMLDELSCIADLNGNTWGNILSPEAITRMATVAGAHVLGLDDRGSASCYQEIGRIEAGYEADLLVLSADRNTDPYQALLQAEEDDILIVFVGGKPLYGTRDFMRDIVAKPSECEDPSPWLGCRSRTARLLCMDTPNYPLSLAETFEALDLLKTTDSRNCTDVNPLWTCEEPETCRTTAPEPDRDCPSTGRDPQGCFRISEVMVNTAGNTSNKAGQYIEICNVCTSAQDIGGFTFTDGDSSGLDTITAVSSSACTDPNWTCGTSVIPAGKCGVILDPDYFSPDNPDTYDFACPGTVILGIASGSALGQGLSASDPVTLYDDRGTRLTNIQDTYGTPACTDDWLDCDDDEADCIPFDPDPGRSAHRLDLERPDEVGNWVIGDPSPGCR